MRIYISNIGDQITDESLGATFATYGEVQDVSVGVDESTGRNSGWAHVDMPDGSEAARAIRRLNGSIINGKVIAVREALRSA